MSGGKKALGLFVLARRYDEFQVKEFLLQLTRKVQLYGIRNRCYRVLNLREQWPLCQNNSGQRLELTDETVTLTEGSFLMAISIEM